MRLIDKDELTRRLNTGMNIIEMMQTVMDMPTIEERKTGRWKKISPAGIYECSECGRNVMTADIEAYEFCHGCGAKMEEGDPE